MSVIYCENCSTHIDTDFNAEHFGECGFKITFGKAWQKQEPARVRHLENLRTIKYLERKLTNRLYIRHTSKKTHLPLKRVTELDYDSWVLRRYIYAGRSRN